MAIKFDDTLVEHFNPAHLSSPRYGIHTFSDGVNKVIFVAIAHEQGKDSPSARTIDFAIKNFPVDAAIIEGIRPNGQQMGLADFSPKNISEITFAVQNLGKFKAAEPGDKDFLRYMTEEKGREARDVYFYDFAYHIYQKQRDKKVEDPEKEFNLFVGVLKEKYGLDAKPEISYQQFLGWFENNHKVHGEPVPFNAEDIRPPESGKTSIFAPLLDHPHFLGRMSAEKSIFRNQHILKVIEAGLNNSPDKRVMIVIGEGHLGPLEKALSAALPQREHHQPVPFNEPKRDVTKILSGR